MGARLVLSAVALLAGAVLLAVQAGSGGEGARPGPAGETCGESPLAGPMAGVSLVAPRRPTGPEIMDPLRRVGADWVGVLPYGFIDPDGDRIRFDRDRQWWGETAEGTAAQVRFARERGLRVMVKPHVWVRAPGWAGDFLPGRGEDRRRWEESYRDYILTFAQVAEDAGADLFVVGTELDLWAREAPDFWRDLIHRVRGVYGGPVTYAANWDAFHLVPFWDELDYIGVDAYFPLSSSATPTVEELVEAWEPRVRAIEEICRRHGLPVLFAEFGYRSVDGAAGRQWDLPPERRRDVEPNYEAQANAYEALFRVWWDRPWFAGGFLWKWFPGDGDPAGPSLADYTPQHKPVEEVIRDWYGREAGSPR